tara:strand:+ start:59 stop:655 length:597 start_codon:yes stop_codon:yes gene_type:complete
MKTFKDLIYENDNSLSPEICKEIILRFKRDDRTKPGITVSGKVMPDIKKSTDLPISGLEEWKDIDQILFKTLTNEVEKYQDTIDKIIGVPEIPLWSANIKDDGYNVKEYKPGDYYNWHVDTFTFGDAWSRTIACIWYLDTVEEGGETEFNCGHKITPSPGKLILFPSTWTYPHRGLPPIKGEKHIITSFILTNDTIHQ